MRLVYFGSGAFGLPTLGALAGRHEIALVVTQPDRPAGRGGAVTPTPVAQWIAANRPGIPVIKPERVNEATVVARIRECRADAWVVIAFGQKLGRALLEGVLAVNLHASLLPRWRGAAPINAAILAGDAETGNSVITLADRMDAGLVLGQSRRAIDPMLTAGELHDLLAQDGPALMESVLADAGAARRTGREQDESLVTIAPKLSKADGWIDLGKAAQACRRRVHGLTPWPGVAVEFRGQPLKLLRVRDGVGREGIPPGTLIDAERGLVACGEGSTLALLEVHPPGKRAMPWAEYARGQRPLCGEAMTGRIGDRA
jgi:methionyl-tRNA formyltransferase